MHILREYPVPMSAIKFATAHPNAPQKPYIIPKSGGNTAAGRISATGIREKKCRTGIVTIKYTTADRIKYCNPFFQFKFSPVIFCAISLLLSPNKCHRTYFLLRFNYIKVFIVTNCLDCISKFFQITLISFLNNQI